MEAMTFGRFGFDMADQIVDHNLFVNDEKKYDIRDIKRVYYKIQWRQRPNGTSPRSSYFDFNTIKDNSPKILIDYLAKCAELRDKYEWKKELLN